MGFQFIDIIILALIAFFIFLRYRNTLGKDIGHKPDQTSSHLRQQMGQQLEERVINMPGAAQKPVEQEEPAMSLDTEIEDAKIGDPDIIATLREIKQKNDNFSLKEFTEGARVAFEWVLNSFDEGDKKTLQKLMSKEVYDDFAEAIDNRKKEKQTLHTTLVSILNSDLIEAELEKDRIARLTVQFTTEQIQMVKDAEGKVIEGDASAVQQVIDEWVFERDIRSNDPAWKIIGT